MRTAQDAIASFAEWDGTAEYPPGSNQNWLTEWYGMGPVAWCAITVSRALIEGGFGTAERIDVPGVRTTSAKGWAYCPYVEDDFRAAGRWYSDPEPGDLVLFDWDDDGWSDHVGMVVSVESDGSIYSWEGNTDEGVVRLKHRSRRYTRGFARPPYVPVTQPSMKELPMEFVYIANGEDWVLSASAGFHGRLPYGDTLDGLKGSDDLDGKNVSPVLADLGKRSPEFHLGVVEFANQCRFAGSRD